MGDSMLTMGRAAVIGTEPGSVQTAVRLIDEVSTWLETASAVQECHREQLSWHPRWRASGVPLRSPEHLAVLISRLEDESFGGVTGPIEGRWVQVMRVSRLWLMEVNHESRGWPERVYRGGPESWPGRHARNGQLWDSELFGSLRVADIAWSWMCSGALPAGIACTSDYSYPEG